MDILAATENLCKEIQEVEMLEEAIRLQRYLSKEVWTFDDRHFVLHELSNILLNERWTLTVAEHFSPLILELLTQCNAATNFQGAFCNSRHEFLCIALGRLIWFSPDTSKFAKSYFETAPSPWARFYENNDVPPKKKKKKMQRKRADLEALLQSALQFLVFDVQYFRDLWNWSALIPLTNSDILPVKCLAYHCIALVGGFSNVELKMLLKLATSDEGQIELSNWSVMDGALSHRNSNFLTFNLPLEKPHPEDSCEEKRRMGIISNCDLHDFVANIEGVLLNRLHGVQEREDPQEIVLVPSVQETLHNIALAISANDAVVLQGPVGCGKTSLVEYLAQMTGRKRQKDLLKIQLGDRMDSKLLIGSHCCTEIPGKFVWQPGVLTEAMLSGHWLLLEDIDCASMDVISTLIPVLQSRSIVLPGRDHPIKAAGGFQLFATQRLLTGHGGTYMEFKSNADILDKLWRKITVSPLSRDDLHLVICAKWPELESIVDRILEVYFMVCTGTNNGDAADNQIALSAHGGRIVSTRDLFKWCKRIAEKVQSKSPETAIVIFKAAIDYFCQSISIMDDRIAVAESIAAKFNIPASKAAFFCKNYKPDINILSDRMEIGQTILCRKQVNDNLERGKRYVFAHTRQSVALLEKVASAVQNHEPVLLVGETGTGKTSVIQYLADITNNDLIVVNMNQQSDSIDLLGGYKPIDLDLVITPLKIEYEKMFCASFSQKQNTKFLMHIMKCFRAKRWGAMFTLMMHTYHEAVKRINSEKYSNAESLLHRWQKLSTKINQLRHQVKDAFKTSVFTFIEGTLVKAMKEGKWILLDEINLAEAETLECFAGVLDRADDSLFLLEKGDKEPVTRHPDFHIFACMNPATDIGKKDLPVGIRNRFTEFFVEELEDKNDLMALVDAYLRGISLSSDAIENIVDFYFHIREKAAAVLSDGASHNPHYSLRTLCRALYVASRNSCDSVPRSLYEAFCLSFLSQLDEASHVEVKSSIMKYILGKKGQQSVLKRIISKPKDGTYLPFEGYWIKVGTLEPCMSENYILTPTVRRNLQDLARIVSIGRYPVLLQGDTSVGKTSLVQWLAEATGNECVRVNNHEHTDIQEYIGGYAANNEGNLVFEEGVLVKAMRNGYWIILDELNLAPTEVMEALNRVLDDNRELFITETQEVIRAHSQFMVFATQNPPGTYGGRKVLSRAFRNRFVELHFSQIPPRELETILEHRCKMPLSYCKRLVAIMAELQLHRGAFGVFAGKQAYFTLRDLFRWGERYKMASAQVTTFYDWDQHLGEEGYMLLAGRVRRPEEEKIIREVIQKHIKCIIDPNQLFAYNGKGSLATASLLNDIVNKTLSTEFKHIVWTDNMRRLTVLVAQALKFNEPILLVGDTGCGKTTVCQLLSAVANKTMYTVNCHMHTESADFLGSLRPYRGQHVEGGQQKLFEWVDGPLVKAMKTGDFFLVDEISLAEDSVLERLNSLLEPERTILLTEKCGDDMGEEVSVRADSNFRIFSTMNPGGDFGKKELSPALRNRFTEIWCPSDLTELDLVCIVQHNIVQNLSLGCTSDTDNGFGLAMSDFVHWFRKQDFGKRYIISIRDILSWVDFINATAISEEYGNALTPGKAYCHGACLVYLDSLGAGITSSEDRSALMAFKKECLKYLIQQVKDLTGEDIDFSSLGTTEFESDLCSYSLDVRQEIEHFGVDPFVIKCGSNISDSASSDYTLESPTPKANVFRIMRALQVSKPILLEGSPGVGKTSLVAAIARASGNDLVRINLSEQTDITDLFGADLPTEGGIGGEFSWRDGPLLQALRNGHWILLDELNLASQSVLEGLNACLDHRGEVFVPELNETFYIRSTSTKIFGCQNPYADGGARKGLPRSFLNRFTQVFVDPLSTADLKCISYHMFPLIPYPLIVSMVNFNQQIVNEVNEDRIWGQDGHPWEFNLRDICRWCEVMLANQDGESFNPGEYVGLIYADRMRTRDDKEKVFEIYQSIFDEGYPISTRQLQLEVFSGFIQLGHSFLPRHGGKYIPGKHYYPLHFQLKAMESLMKCIELRWMAILLGPSGCGKTSMVQFLASLIGHPLDVLSMNSELDTTELLGGFEQADFARHIDGVCEDLSAVVWTTAVQCFVRNEDVELLTLKEVISKKAEFDKIRRSGAEGDAVLLSQIDRLKHILNLLGALPLSENEVAALLHCKETLDDVSKKLSESNGAISGGKFEWVDGVLVRAIKKGHWLLIENANFCSASVLDRLNGLLEPGGVLTINEQGAIGEELVTITPHDDFRIVLTMDPKKGEISRAMRNRGVEIALLSEGQCLPDKGEILDIWDIVTLFQSRHLRHPQLIEILLKIHQGLGAAAYCNVSFSDLLSCASLVMQNIQHKVDVQSALWNSLTAVYVKPILDCTMKENSCVLIRDMMVKYFFKLDSKAIPLPLLCQSSSDFQLDDNLASIKQKGMLFQYILHHITCAIMRKSYLKETPLPEFFKKISFPPCEWVKTVVFTIRIVIEKISFSNWNHARSWMEHCFSEAGSMDMAEFPGFQYVDKMKSFFCTYMLESLTFPAVKELKNILHKMVDNASLCSTDKDDIPWDPRWNPCLFNKLLHDLKSGNSDCDIDDMKEKMVSLANRFHLLLILASIHLEVLSVLYLKNGSRCLLAMSRDFGKNERSQGTLHHPVIEHLCPFFGNFHESVRNLLMKENSSCSNDVYWKVWEILNTYYSIVKVCCETFNERSSPSMFPDLLSRLTLLWPSVLKEVLNIFNIKSCHCSVPSEVMTCALRISHELGLNYRNDHKLRSKLVKFIGFPSALSSKEAARVHQDVIKLASTVNLSMVMKSQSNLENLRVALSQNGHWNRVLSDAFQSSLSKLCHQSQLTSERNALHRLELQLCEAGLLENGDEDVMEVCDDVLVVPQLSSNQVAVQLQLLPLWDYFFVLIEVEMVAHASKALSDQLLYFEEDKFQNTRINVSLLNYLTEIGISKLQLDPVHVGILLSGKYENIKNIFSELLVSFLDNTRNGFSSRDLLSCLHWDPNGNVYPDNSWKTEITWANQSPVLTYICFNVLSNIKVENTLEASLTLGTGLEKGKQITIFERLLWRNCDALWNKGKFLRKHAALVVTSWFDSLVSAIALCFKIPCPHDIIPSNLASISDKLGLSTKMCLVDNADALLLAAQSIEELKSCLKNYDADTRILLWIIGKCYTYVGLLTLFLLAPTDSTDPVEKYEVKSNCCGAMLKDVQRELELRNLDSLITSGNHLEAYHSSDLHPFITSLIRNELSLNAKYKELKTKLAYRPFPSQFSKLQSEVRHYLQSVGSPSVIYKNAKKMEILKHHLEEGNCTVANISKCLLEVQKFRENQMSFVDQIKQNYPCYRDLTLPFLAGVEQVILGTKMMSSFVSSLNVLSDFPAKSFSSVEEFLIQMASFPTMKQNGEFLRPLEICSFLSDEKNISGINFLCSTDISHENVQWITLKSMKCAVLEMQNEILIHKKTNPDDIFLLISAIFKTYCEAWIKQENEFKLAKEQEASLYEQKVHYHDEDKSDEEQNLRDMNALFPSYKEEFSEFLSINNEIEGAVTSDHVTSNFMQLNAHLSDKELLEIWSMHAELLASITDVSDSVPKSELSNIAKVFSRTPDFATPYHLRYEILKRIVLANGEKFDNILDVKLLGGHLFACSAAKSLVNISNEGPEMNKYYDIYHDPNPPEVLECRPLLENLSCCINNLLEQFPDNPLLTQVLKIVDRILSFTVNSPLMKYLTGLELVLESAQAWEQNAHKGVSLCRELSEITDKIIHCRRIELNCWRQCLDNVVKKQYAKCAKWWFHLYSLIFFTNNDDEVLNQGACDKAFRDSSIKTLQQFMEDSELGQFAARLDLLRTFFLHVLLSPRSSPKRKFLAVLFNIYNFYKQFLPAVMKKIDDIRTPIEKEIKDYVKIAQWNDTNFVTVKQTVEKSHNTIHKYMKNFEKELVQPIKSSFHVPSKKDLEEIESTPWSLKIDVRYFTSKLKLPEFFHLPDQVAIDEKTLYSMDEKNFISNISHFHRKSNKFCKKILELYPVLNYINFLNDFSGEIIEVAQNLGSLVVTKDEDKKRQVMEAKQIHHSKRKALSKLFKTLSILGLSYSQGLIYCRNRNESDSMVVPHLDVNNFVYYMKDKTAGEIVKACWNGANHYFYKCIAQFSSFLNALQKPSKELSLEIVQKSQGFSGHLMELAITQRKILAKEIEDLAKFRNKVLSLLIIPQGNDCTERKNLSCLPSQDFANQWRVKLCNIIIQTISALQQFIILMECCPLPAQEKVFDIDLPACLPPLATASKRDHLWTTTVNQAQNILEKARNIISKLMLELESSNIFLTWGGIKTFSECFDNLFSLSEDIARLKTGIEHQEETNYFTESLQSVYSLIITEHLKFKGESSVILEQCSTWTKPAEDLDSELITNQEIKFSKVCNELLQSVLFAIQGLFVLCNEHKTITGNLKLEEMNHKLISEKINEHLFKTRDLLSVHKIKKNVTKLLKCINKNKFMGNIVCFEKCVRMACKVAPLLFQYVQLVEFYISVSFGMHRTTCKILSVLLGIFDNLCQKGFCLPQESQKENEQCNSTEFHDIENGGLGEGEGVRDISGNVRSEDQLEDVMKEGTEKTEQELDPPDIKEEKDGIEMSEDFDGKLHEPDTEISDESDEDYNDDSEPELDKKMGDVDSNQATDLNEKLWGSDSENENEDLDEDESNKGTVEKGSSELAPKNEKQESCDESETKDKEEKSMELHDNEMKNEDEYEEDNIDPLINKQPPDEPEIMELPNEMNLDKKTDDSDDDREDEQNEFDIDAIKKSLEQDNENGEEEGENVKEGNSDIEVKPEQSAEEPMEQDDVEGDNDSEMCPNQEVDAEDDLIKEKNENEQTLSSFNKTEEFEALAAEDMKKNKSNDNVEVSECDMDWEGGGGEQKEQHKEGQADFKDCESHEVGYEGNRTTAPASLANKNKKCQRFKHADENRSLASVQENIPEKLHTVERKKTYENLDNADVSRSDCYEHIKENEKEDCVTLDIATDEQVLAQALSAQETTEDSSIEEEEDDDDDVIAVDDSDDEDEEEVKHAAGRTFRSKSGRNGNHGDSDDEEEDEEDNNSDIPGEHIVTSGVSRGPLSTIHTQFDLWTALSMPDIKKGRIEVEQELEHFNQKQKEGVLIDSKIVQELWQKCEDNVSPLVQELCEQLRLVLEPTKMTKLKGDYRSGKRLNMRKIIPYIASQFRKDKIWLRRMKPSKRQYQIMLAIDDSSSMTDNHSKQLAFESLALIGKSLSLLEAGELSIVSFGESIKLLNSFSEPFTDSVGCRILKELSFSQNRTRFGLLLNYATDMMIQSRTSNCSRLISKEIAQLLLIISDGRGIFNEGEELVHSAVRRARDNNVFMIFVVLDNSSNEQSILDIRYPIFDPDTKELVEFKPYMSKFPFPFYILLREINSLPLVLGEALRKWFELVTSVDR